MALLVVSSDEGFEALVRVASLEDVELCSPLSRSGLLSPPAPTAARFRLQPSLLKSEYHPKRITRSVTI